MEIEELLGEKTYPGRGIIVGRSPQGRAVVAYFIMGRSENSRNRVLALERGASKLRLLIFPRSRTLPLFIIPP